MKKLISLLPYLTSGPLFLMTMYTFRHKNLSGAVLDLCLCTTVMTLSFILETREHE